MFAGPTKGGVMAWYTLLTHEPDLQHRGGIYGNVYIGIQYPTFFWVPQCMCKQCVPGPLLSLKGLGTRLGMHVMLCDGLISRFGIIAGQSFILPKMFGIKNPLQWMPS